MHPGTRRAVFLAPAASAAQSPHQAAELEVAHGPILARTPYRWLTRPLAEQSIARLREMG